MIHTRINELLGIRYPIIQGGMAWVSDSSLASAVTNAGGLGVISAMNGDAEHLRREIIKTREAVGGKPFGVNIMLMSPIADQLAAVAAEERVPVVLTGAGSPARYMPLWLEAGAKVIPVIPSSAAARSVEKAGAAAVVAEGCESGGHVGEMTTMALVPQVADAVDIPVIAAGGIADGRGAAAAFMLGAVGIQCGTCFLVAEECRIHENYKQKVIDAIDRDTIVTGRRLGHPVRSIKNRFSRRFGELEYDMTCSDEELEVYGAGALRKAALEGDPEGGGFMAGQIAGMIKERRSAAAIIEAIMTEAEALLRGAPKWVE